MFEYKVVFRPLEGIVTKKFLKAPGASSLPFWKRILDTLALMGLTDSETGALNCSLEEMDFRYKEFLNKSKPNDYSYSNNNMPYHVGLVVGDKLFEYEDDDMYYKGYKPYNVNYNSKIKWQDLCPGSNDPKIHGTTNTSPDMLDAKIKSHADSSWRTKGHYDLFEHNCQHFTHFAVNQLN